MSESPVTPVLQWYARHRRDLPWRATSPWGVLVSEFMLQQTPVARVLPVWTQWLTRWPNPADLAAASRAEVIGAWGRLGYPRRALRLHASAVRIAEVHDGRVPADYDLLRALPGVGDYTAAAVLAFAFGERIAVIDVNVARVLRRSVLGTDTPAPPTALRVLATDLLPRERARAARWSAAVMELGALVCTARNPSCDRCPLRQRCAWVDAGATTASPRARASYAGSDRQARGAVLAALRSAHDGRVNRADLAWPDPGQLERAITSLHADGLITLDGHLIHL
jgi:A/G-specific adenine glycosylase